MDTETEKKEYPFGQFTSMTEAIMNQCIIEKTDEGGTKVVFHPAKPKDYRTEIELIFHPIEVPDVECEVTRITDPLTVCGVNFLGTGRQDKKNK